MVNRTPFLQLFRKTAVAILLATLVAATASFPAVAQDLVNQTRAGDPQATGSVSGRVVDQSAAPVAGVHVKFRQADSAGARTQLLAAASQLRGLGGRADSVLAQALQYLGEIDIAARHPADAIGPLQEGAALLVRFAPSGWNLAMMRERLAEAVMGAGRPGAADLVSQALPVLVAELGESHPQTVRARKLLQTLRPAAAPAAAPG